jgi:hypothetical protein
MMSTAAAQAQSLAQQTSHQRHEVIGLYRRCIRCANSIMDAGWRLSYLEYTRDSFRRNRQLPHSSYQAKDARNYAEEQLERMKYYISVNLQIQKYMNYSSDKKVQAEDSPLSVLRPLSSLFSAVDKQSGRNAVKKIDSSKSNDEAKDDEGVNFSPSLAEESSIIATKPMEDLFVIDELESIGNTAKAPFAVGKEIGSDQADVSSQLTRKDKGPEDTKARLLIQLPGSDYTDEKNSEELMHDIPDERIFEHKQEDQEFSGSKEDLLENFEFFFERGHMDLPPSQKEHKVATVEGGRARKIRKSRQKIGTFGEQDKVSSKKEHEVATAEGGRARKIRKSTPKLGTFGEDRDIPSTEKSTFKSMEIFDTDKSADIAMKTTALSLAPEESNSTDLVSIDSSGEEKLGADVSPSDLKLQTIESFLKEAVPHLYPIDIQTYTKQLVNDGFDSIPMLESQLLLEDLHFMKKAHARALWVFIQTKRE